jgi:hypothetical protein
VVALLALSGGLTSLSKAIAAGYAGDQLDDRIDANRMAVALGSLRSLVFVAATAVLLFLAAEKRLRAPLLGWGLAAILALDLWSVERHYWQFSPRASVIYASDPAIDYVKRAEPGRVLALQLGDEGAAFRDPFFGGDALMAHRIRLVRGYHGNEIGRYQRLASREQVGDYGNLVNPAFWRLTNARFLYTNAALSDSSAGVSKILGPVRNAAGSTVYLYRLPGDNPPAWVTTAMAKAGDEATAATMLDPRFDPLRVAVIDSAAQVQVAPLGALPEPLGIAAKVIRYDPGHIALDLSAPAPAGSALVVSENYYPGWTARVNDRDAAPVVRADYTFIGVPLPAGATRVSLDFHDPAYGTGKVVTLIAVLLALLGIAAGVVVDRRARVG